MTGPVTLKTDFSLMRLSGKADGDGKKKKRSPPHALPENGAARGDVHDVGLLRRPAAIFRLMLIRMSSFSGEG